MIHQPNGHDVEFVVASGAMGFDGQGWFWDRPLVRLGLIDPSLFVIVLKTITREPIRGNMRVWRDIFGFGCVRHIREGTVNAVGMTNPGFNYFYDEICPHLKDSGLRIVVSIEGTPEEIGYMTTRLNRIPGIIAVELNVSCTNIPNGIANTDTAVECVHQAHNASIHPIWVKVSVAQDYLAIARRVAGMVSAIDINSVPWKIFDPKKRSPLAKLGGGGVSGRAAMPFTWIAIKRLIDQGEKDSCYKIPVIGPSIWDYHDIERLQSLGASAFSFGAIHIPNLWKPWTWLSPAKPTRYVRRWNREH